MYQKKRTGYFGMTYEGYRQLTNKNVHICMKVNVITFYTFELFSWLVFLLYWQQMEWCHSDILFLGVFKLDYAIHKIKCYWSIASPKQRLTQPIKSDFMSTLRTIANWFSFFFSCYVAVIFVYFTKAILNLMVSK